MKILLQPPTPYGGSLGDQALVLGALAGLAGHEVRFLVPEDHWPSWNVPLERATPDFAPDEHWLIGADCVDGPRPCPFVSCKYHLYLDVKEETQSIKLNFPHLEVWEMEHSCALDVSEQGGLTLEEVGHILNLTRERVRQVEVAGIDKLKSVSVVEDIERIFGPAVKFEDI